MIFLLLGVAGDTHMYGNRWSMFLLSFRIRYHWVLQ